MKIPKAKQLPSGSWFVRLRVGGQDIGVTKPTEKEAVAEAMAIKAGLIHASRTPSNGRTLAVAVEDYITSRENVLSPSTIAGYRVIQRNRFPSLQRVRICDITPQKWQTAVNLEARTVSPKTLKNSAMFIQTVVRESGGPDLSARLSQVVPHDLPWLTPEQIPVFLAALQGSRYEIPALLALSGLRHSEVIAMRWEDIDLEAGCIHVRGAAVKADDGAIVFKAANKTAASRRTVPFLIPQLREAVEQADHAGEYIYPTYSTALRRNINAICQKTGLPEVGCHGLRRSFASLCYHLGIPDAVTMQVGGWSDLATMRKIYTKISERDIANQADRFAEFFKNGNENGNEI